VNEISPEIRDRVRTAVASLSASRKPDGDAWEADGEPAIEATAWAGLAFLAALKDDSLRERAKAELDHAYRYITQRQSAEGGWGSRETEYHGARTITAYSTFIALRFLLRLHQRVKDNGPSGEAVRALLPDDGSVEEQIRKGLYWILNTYDADAKAWREYGGAGIQKDLATLYLIVLVDAKQSGFESLASHRAFQAAIENWIRIGQSDSMNRQVIENTQLAQEQYRYDKSGQPLRGNALSAPNASIVWHPWSLLLSSYLKSETTLTPTQREQVSSIYPQLFRRLPETVTAFSSGFTFMATEMLYVMGEIPEISAAVLRPESGRQ
jgi:hypothetical protein